MDRYVADAWEALIATAVDAVCGGFADAVIRHEDMVERSRVLREEITARNLLGSKLHALAAGFVAEVEKRSLKRLTDQWDSPSFSAGALIDEIRGADADVLKVINNRPAAPTAGDEVELATTLLRARIIAVATQADCIADPPRSRSPGAPRGEKNRREIGVGNLPAALLDPICRSADAGADWREHLRPLKELEKTAVNASSIVTKVLALADATDGRRHINEIAERIRAARFSAPGEIPSEKSEIWATATRVPAIADDMAPPVEEGSAPAREPTQPVLETVSAPPVFASAQPIDELWPGEIATRNDVVAAKQLLAWLDTATSNFTSLLCADSVGQIQLKKPPYSPRVIAMLEQAIGEVNVQARLRQVVADRATPA